MKRALLTTLIALLALSACNLNKPLDYYNTAVGAGNASNTFLEMEQRLNRLESGMHLDPQDLSGPVSTRTAYSKKLLEDIIRHRLAHANIMRHGFQILLDRLNHRKKFRPNDKCCYPIFTI